MKKKGVCFRLYNFLILSMFGIVAYAFLISNSDVELFTEDSVWVVDGDFSYIDADGNEYVVDDVVQLPMKLDGNTSEQFKVKLKVKDTYKGKTIAVSSSSYTVDAYIDEECVYLSPRYEETPILPGRGLAIEYIDIKDEFLGKEIILEYNSVYDFEQSVLKNIYIGDSNDITIRFLKDGLFAIVCSLMLLFIGLLLIILSIVFKNGYQGKTLLYLGQFSIMMCIISMSSIDILKVIFQHNSACRLLIIETLTLICISSVLFLKTVNSKRFEKFYDLQMYIAMIVFVIQNTCHILGIKDIVELRWMSYMVMVIEFIISGGITIVSGLMKLEDDRSKRLGKLKYGLTFMFTTMVIDIINSYQGWYPDTVMCSRFGLMFYIFIVAIDALAEIYRMVFTSQKAQMLKEIASEDILTKAYSRTAYEEEMRNIVDNMESSKQVAIVSFDLNDLKIMNDNYGHEAGDQYLIDCVSVITNAFDKFGECYRVGGDEFIVIIKDFISNKFNNRINYMKNAVIEWKNLTGRQMSMSYGFAVFDDTKDKDIYDTAKRADAMMYQAKKECKERRKKEAKKQDVINNYNANMDLRETFKKNYGMTENVQEIIDANNRIEFEEIPNFMRIDSSNKVPDEVSHEEYNNRTPEDIAFEKMVEVGIKETSLEMSDAEASHYIRDVIELVESNPYISMDIATREMHRKNEMNTLENQINFQKELKEYERTFMNNSDIEVINNDDLTIDGKPLSPIGNPVGFNNYGDNKYNPINDLILESQNQLNIMNEVNGNHNI